MVGDIRNGRDVLIGHINHMLLDCRGLLLAELLEHPGVVIIHAGSHDLNGAEITGSLQISQEDFCILKDIPSLPHFEIPYIDVKDYKPAELDDLLRQVREAGPFGVINIALPFQYSANTHTPCPPLCIRPPPKLTKAPVETRAEPKSQLGLK